MKKMMSPVVKKQVQQIGKYLSLWRRIRRITLKEAAERSRISQDTLYRLEHGDAGVSIGALLSVCRMLNITDLVIDGFDPARTEYGRAQMVAGVPKKIKN